LGKLHELLLPKMWVAMHFHQGSTCGALRVGLYKKANNLRDQHETLHLNRV
jgi:hypothetical protein